MSPQPKALAAFSCMPVLPVSQVCLFFLRQLPFSLAQKRRHVCKAGEIPPWGGKQREHPLLLASTILRHTQDPTEGINQLTPTSPSMSVYLPVFGGGWLCEKWHSPGFQGRVSSPVQDPLRFNCWHALTFGPLKCNFSKPAIRGPPEEK